MGRIEIICSYLDDCQSFADVGCDHGYCTLNAFNSGKCKTAVISDVSAKCLAKAQTLLKQYIDSGVCKSVCCDGLKGIPKDTEQVLIAGMGGMEIIKILKEGFIPQKFVLQPMKNCKLVREYLLDNGCKLTVDDMFYDGKYYFIIKGERSENSQKYSNLELYFGRDSLKNPLFKEYAQAEIEKKESFLANCSKEARTALQGEISLYKKAKDIYDL